MGILLGWYNWHNKSVIELYLSLNIILKSANYNCIYWLISIFLSKGMLCVFVIVRGEKYLQTGEKDLVNMRMKKKEKIRNRGEWLLFECVAKGLILTCRQGERDVLDVSDCDNELSLISTFSLLSSSHYHNYACTYFSHPHSQYQTFSFSLCNDGSFSWEMQSTVSGEVWLIWKKLLSFSHI